MLGIDPDSIEDIKPVAYIVTVANPDPNGFSETRHRIEIV